LLELEGQLTPILASLVTVEEKSRQMLDHTGNTRAKQAMDASKARMHTLLHVDISDKALSDATIESICPAGQSSVRGGLQRLENPPARLRHMHTLVGQLCEHLQQFADSETNGATVPSLYLDETFELAHDRWQILNKDFWVKKTGAYDLSKVPDVYDMIRFDVQHNFNVLALYSGTQELLRLSRDFADCVVPQEYGIDEADKRHIGSIMCGPLLQKIRRDLLYGVKAGMPTQTQGDHDPEHEPEGDQEHQGYTLDHSHAQDLAINSLNRMVRTRLYFTSESHLHSLLNVLRYPPDGSPCALDEDGRRHIEQCSELSYLTQVVFRLFQSKQDPQRFRCEILFTPGAIDDANAEDDDGGPSAMSLSPPTSPPASPPASPPGSPQVLPPTPPQTQTQSQSQTQTQTYSDSYSRPASVSSVHGASIGVGVGAGVGGPLKSHIAPYQVIQQGVRVEDVMECLRISQELSSLASRKTSAEDCAAVPQPCPSCVTREEVLLEAKTAPDLDTSLISEGEG
jgi:inositol hexakisphosphate/diphosphoinositol-pentakisphosphate kinase